MGVVAITQLRHLGAVSQWNEVHRRTQLNSKNHTTREVMVSTSPIPVLVGDPNAVPTTPDYPDHLLLAASDSPLGAMDVDDGLVPGTGTSAESPLLSTR